MQRTINDFLSLIRKNKELGDLYLYLKDGLKLPNNLDDLLRAQWVYAVSALDKLVHELVKIGMVDVFLNRRAPTPKFGTFTIGINTHLNIAANSFPSAQHWFEQEIISKHKTESFQDPAKIRDALSLFWLEEHKWQKISALMAEDEHIVTTTLKNIVARRNQIVHEADLNPITKEQINISFSEAKDVVNFIEKLGVSIFTLVK